ncbi:uncharacterized protein [Paramormyrops kingsleyae]|uniref:Protein FAM89A-like n=1 Tax=Paramormyrops kingsleyae TaxID=1676925 RepID=A0A3B3Q1I4_9TELE|nr:protein FAM89A-like [Paramormyrops kingsleyae]
MEVVLTRLRDFSRKTATFEDFKPTAVMSDRASQREHDLARGGQFVDEDGGPCQLDIESALAWLRRELMEMRSQDQILIQQLMELHAGIQELKLECAEAEEELEEEEEEEELDEEEEAKSWDSGSEFAIPYRCWKVGCGPYASASVPLCYRESLLGRAISRRSSVP